MHQGGWRDYGGHGATLRGKRDGRAGGQIHAKSNLLLLIALRARGAPRAAGRRCPPSHAAQEVPALQSSRFRGAARAREQHHFAAWVCSALLPPTPGSGAGAKWDPLEGKLPRSLCEATAPDKTKASAWSRFAPQAPPRATSTHPWRPRRSHSSSVNAVQPER